MFRISLAVMVKIIQLYSQFIENKLEGIHTYIHTSLTVIILDNGIIGDFHLLLQVFNLQIF